MKQAIINILNAIADRIGPCGHKWVMFDETRVRKSDDWGTSRTFSVLHFHCSKCGKYKRVKSS